ncbi:MAG: NmrA family NAD(P)-binding protein [Burkholderiales bacterium]
MRRRVPSRYAVAPIPRKHTMIVIAGRPQGFISRSIASVLYALPGRKRFVSARPFSEPLADEDIESLHVRATGARDTARALEDARSLVLLGSLNRDQTELQLALIRDARAAGVEKLVFISLIGASAQSPVEVLRRLGQLERAVQASGVPFVILRCAPYMQSLRLFMQIEGLSLALAGPFHNARFAWIDARDVADVVALLLQGPLDNSVKQLCGPEQLDFDGIASILCDCTQRDCTFNDLSTPQAQGLLEGAGFSTAYARALLEYWDYIVSGAVGTTPCDTAPKILGRPLRTLAECAPTFVPQRDAPKVATAAS